MNSSSITSRLVFITTVTAFSVGLVAIYVFLKISHAEAQARALESVSELNNTVAPTASIAAYLKDSELGNEVINGLVSNAIIRDASLSSDSFRVSSDDFDVERSPVSFPVFSPFEGEKKIGEVDIIINYDYILSRANSIATRNVLIIFIISVTIIVVVTAISYIVIAKPIINIQRQLHKIEPGTKERVSTPKFHKLSELGTLTEDANFLLSRAESQIDREIVLRKEVEQLGRRFRMIFENSSAATVLIDESSSIILANPAFDHLMFKAGLPKKERYGDLMCELFDGKTEFIKNIHEVIAGKGPFNGELKILSQNDIDDVWVYLVCSSSVDDNGRNYYQFSMHDITQSRLRIRELDMLANFDQLTGLENRQSAEVKLQKLIDKREKFSLVLMDLDGFKPINDVYGHDSGDKILKHVANNLKSGVRKDDICSRWGGDEFVLAFIDSDEDDVVKIADGLIKKVSSQLYLDDFDESVSVGASMGCVVYQQDNENLNTLIRLADEAMYSVKLSKSSGGKDHIHFSGKT
ncbi:sensor domain-containing diguanylate cyclase [uncultured Pseudoteredinibacter sp.]|uniref:sensor domain-containing diguanylate cyclase n=1 Tax=uncultured Pseudoteredinibacter sp. TaxID=1641701 RepID=UPI002618A2B4|nr:sensor domain-containing diguanylate cyclase [uncultured Pseudoteredinibacter sp.]